MKKNGSTGSTLGEKVRVWLADNRKARRDPQNPTALGRKLKVSQQTARDWIANGAQPRTQTAHQLAGLMGVPIRWLLDDSQPAEPRPEGVSLGDLLDSLTEEEARLLLVALRDPTILRAVVELGRAKELGPDMPGRGGGGSG